MYQSNYLAVMDSETLGRWDDAIVLSVAVTLADLTKKIEFIDLVNNHTFFIKLDAMEQRKLGRLTDKPTMEWWKGIGTKYGPSEEAKAVSLHPKDDDRSIFTLSDDIRVGCHRLGVDPTKVDWCDRNLFDLRKVQHIIEITCNQYDNVPWDYHHTFDVVSWLKGIGQNDRYAGVKAWELEGMVYHDPRHDAALDWLRIQKTMIEKIRFGGQMNTITINIPEGLHPDTVKLVTETSEAMAAKLFKAQVKYGFDNGWKVLPSGAGTQDGRHFWTREECLKSLFNHMGKGDPIDCINYLEFMLANGWKTELPKVDELSEIPKQKYEVTVLYAYGGNKKDKRKHVDKVTAVGVDEAVDIVTDMIEQHGHKVINTITIPYKLLG